jgi:hypothetical protein
MPASVSRLSLKESIHVYVDDQGTLRTDHIFRFWNLECCGSTTRSVRQLISLLFGILTLLFLSCLSTLPSDGASKEGKTLALVGAKIYTSPTEPAIPDGVGSHDASLPSPPAEKQSTDKRKS